MSTAEAMHELDRAMTRFASRGFDLDVSIFELGNLHRALRLALAEVEQALAPKIVNGAGRGMTYVELASAAGYGSTTTITKIMKAQGASPGRGPKPFRHR